jgi:hypothetical protein
MIIRPVTDNRDRNLIITGTVKGPVIGVRNLFNDIHRMCIASDIELKKVHVRSLSLDLPVKAKSGFRLS